MDKLDRQILDILQANYPLEISPYDHIAEKIGITEAEVIKRIGQLKDNGIIRRIGAIIDAKSMGYYSTLCATTVVEDRIEEVAKIINQKSEVTHNYIREHELNVWFTLTAASREAVLGIIRDLEAAAKVKIYAMPARKVYKIRVALEMGGLK